MAGITTIREKFKDYFVYFVVSVIALLLLINSFILYKNTVSVLIWTNTNTTCLIFTNVFIFHVEGKGLGLYLVRTQVEAIGGRIEVESKLDVGTTFTVYLER